MSWKQTEMPSDMQGRKITKYPATYFSRGHSTCQVTQEYQQARAILHLFIQQIFNGYFLYKKPQ